MLLNERIEKLEVLGKFPEEAPISYRLEAHLTIHILVGLFWLCRHRKTGYGHRPRQKHFSIKVVESMLTTDE